MGTEKAPDLFGGVCLLWFSNSLVPGRWDYHITIFFLVGYHFFCDRNIAAAFVRVGIWTRVILVGVAFAANIAAKVETLTNK